MMHDYERDLHCCLTTAYDLGGCGSVVVAKLGAHTLHGPPAM